MMSAHRARESEVGTFWDAQNPPNLFVYVNDVPSDITTVEPSPPVTAPVGDSGFEPEPWLPDLCPIPPFVRITGRTTARTMMMIAAAPIPNQM